MERRMWRCTLATLAGLSAVWAAAAGPDARPGTPPKAQGGAGSAIHLRFDFERPELDRGCSGGYETPVRLGSGDGAMGSKGYVQAGPHDGKWVGVRFDGQFVLRDDTWLGFAARKPGGGKLEVQINDPVRKKNVTKDFYMPGDGTWATFCFPVKLLGIALGAELRGMGFWLDRNDRRAALAFDMDNVVVGSGKDFPPPGPVPPPKAVLDKAGVRLCWSAPVAQAGVAGFRVYRGLHPAFARDAAHLRLESKQPVGLDNAFAHNGDYFYVVRALDYAGNEGTDAGAVRIRVE